MSNANVVAHFQMNNTRRANERGFKMKTLYRLKQNYNKF